jgi:multisubunit Na+/H+ antiporter MnhB subunit
VNRVSGPDHTRLALRLALGMGAVALWAAMAWALLALPDPLTGITAHVVQELPHSGVEHPVTAVLLNFRGYDTLLEIAVLLLAVLAALSLRGTDVPRRLRGVGPPGAILGSMVRLLMPAIVVIAGYLLWAGEHAPGGAFQAGAVLGAGFVLLTLAGMLYLPRAYVPLRPILVLGLAMFLGIAALMVLFTGFLLGYPPGWAKTLILLIETALTVSIGITLATLFAVSPPVPTARSERE